MNTLLQRNDLEITQMTQNILAVHPHPDDEISKAGALAKHVKNGDKVTLICATSGQMGRRMGKPLFANRETLARLREGELRASCNAIGIDDIRLWRMQDKTVQFRNPEELANRIETVIAEVEPSIVYTFYPGHGVHPDHNAIGAATVLAVSRFARDKQPTVYGTCMTGTCSDTLGEPDIKLDVSDVIEEKMNAFRAHRSQSELDTIQLDEELRVAPNKRKEILAQYLTEYFWIYKTQH